MKSLYECGMKPLLDKPHSLPYCNDESIHPCFLAQGQNSVKKLQYLLVNYIKIMAAACLFYFSIFRKRDC
ncbi:hypothetical protein [Wolbachia endosymbiont of Trichogramma kaykai]|uniref:hypothetical protein n=1 Tax=Wolbachia endosymbiont of Trichogramma kaykai TaxID=444066 RepID=UPI0038915C50